MKLKVKGLLLAAGSSSRMRGSSKQLLPWGQTTMIGHCISEVQRSRLDSLLVVLGAEAAKIQAVIPAETNIVINKQWSDGIASSIRAGVDHIASKDPVDGILIMLADQPFVSTAYLNELIEAFDSRDTIVASTYDHGLGVPALFGADHFDLLAALEGDKGAGSILNTRRDSIKIIESNTELTDIDTIDSYSALRPPLDS